LPDVLPLRGDVNAQLGRWRRRRSRPYLVSHLGLSTWLVTLYVIVILSACYSVIDNAFTATSSVFIVDIIKPLFPKIGEKQLFFWAKAPMFLTAVIGAAVILTGADFVTIVLTSYAIRIAILIPLVLALFCSRTTGWEFVGGTILAIAIGVPIRSVAGELWGSLSILAISAAVPLVIGYSRNLRFNFERLRHVKDAALYSAPEAISAE
jgi:Na+/proline symporter